jgi:hypothetical protein
MTTAIFGEFFFLLKWVIKFPLKWVTSCRSYVRFISLSCPVNSLNFCPVNSLKCLSPVFVSNIAMPHVYDVYIYTKHCNCRIMFFPVVMVIIQYGQPVVKLASKTKHKVIFGMNN